MTRRIALAILATCWLVLLAGGAVAYVGVRQALIDDLDASLALRASSLPEVLRVAAPASAHALPEGDRYIIRDRRGQTVARPPTAATPKPKAALRSGRFVELAGGTRGRSVTVAFPDAGATGTGGAAGGTAGGGDEMTVMYTGSAEPFHRLMNRLLLIFAAVGAAAGLLTAWAARAVARAALRPLTAAARTIQSIDDRTLDRRLDLAALPLELRPMCERLNQLLGRLDDGLRERKQFVADAAHQLRTPVTALLTNMEVSLRRPRDAAALTRVLRECVQDARVLRRLVDALLEQFRLEASPPKVEHLNVAAILDLCVESVASLARQRDVTVARSYPPELWASVDATRLRSIVANVLDNAIEYNVAGGLVDVRCVLADGGAINLAVRDTGRGIAEERVPNVFEPFVRGGEDGDGADACVTGHAGLGLFLVRSHVTALGGTCEVSSTPGRGSEFRIRLRGSPDESMQSHVKKPMSPSSGQPAETAQSVLTTVSSSGPIHIVERTVQP